jgi:hypothetical protein
MGAGAQPNPGAAGPPPGVTLTPLPSAAPATPPAGSQAQGAAPSALTENPQSEGTYQMTAVKGGTPAQVPYSKVPLAMQQGYGMDLNGDGQRYMKDRAADPKTSTLGDAAHAVLSIPGDVAHGLKLWLPNPGELAKGAVKHEAEIPQSVASWFGGDEAKAGIKNLENRLLPGSGNAPNNTAQERGANVGSVLENSAGEKMLAKLTEAVVPLAEGADYAEKLKNASPIIKAAAAHPKIARVLAAGLGQSALAGGQVAAHGGSAGDIATAATIGGGAGAAGPVASEFVAPKIASTVAAQAAKQVNVGDLVSSKLDDLLGEIGPDMSKEDTGAAVGKVVKNIHQTARDAANQAYNPLKEPLGLPANATRDQIVEAAQNASKPQPSGVLDASGKPTMTPGDGGKALADLKDADTAYGASRDEVNSALVKKLSKPGNPPELAYRYIQQAGMDDMESVLDKLDAPTRAGVARNVLSDVLGAGGETDDFKAAKALKAYRKLDANGEKSSILFGDNAGKIEDTLQSIADLTDSPAKRVAFGDAVRSVAHSMAYGGMVGGTVGHVAGSYEAGAAVGTGVVAATYAPKVMRAVIGNPRIGGFLTSAIKMGARPEVYGPMIAKMVQEYNEGQQQPAPSGGTQ